jgi:APA family basic amino acid/polyamine antiporter
MDLPLNAAMPDEERAAIELLEDAQALVESYGVRAVTRLERARRAGEAIVENAKRRDAELIVMGARRRPPGRAKVVGGTVRFVLRNAGCRTLVAAARAAA